MTEPGASSHDVNRRQKRMGPAPFASIEDLSDELDSPEDKNLVGSVVRLPGIREDATPTPTPTTPSITGRVTQGYVYSGISLLGATHTSQYNNTMSSLSAHTKQTIKIPNTPRIDISRASSSSHHDSRDSTPDRELYEGHDPHSAKLGLGFKEDGTLDLRSSTEELDFHDIPERKRSKGRVQSPLFHDESRIRKDSQCSDIVLLSISGRTSRLSSIGSQGSAQSRLSNASYLSQLSGQSGLSRGSSPHKMLLETSFCGTKTPELQQEASKQVGTKVESEVLERVLLSRKHDPTAAILAEGITVDVHAPSNNKSMKTAPEKPVRKIDKHNQNITSEITIKIDSSPLNDSENAPKLPSRFISKSGVEYFYIPLKGPLPPANVDASTTNFSSKPALRETKSATYYKPTANNKLTDDKQKSKSTTPSPIIRKKDSQTEPKYIRIKLKPDYMYDESKTGVQKPDSLNLDDKNKATKQLHLAEESRQIEECTEFRSVSPTIKTDYSKSMSSSPSVSPKLSKRKTGVVNSESVTPSPSVSRRSSFASLFRNRDGILSPDSPTMSLTRRKNTLTGFLSESFREHRNRSKSKDRERGSLSAAPSSTESIDSKTKQMSLFSVFKMGKKNERAKSDAENCSLEALPSIEGIGKLEFKFNGNSATSLEAVKKYYETPLEGESIRIPLHSPSHEENHALQDWKTSSQDSQETVIDATSRNVNAVTEATVQIPESNNIEQNCKSNISEKKTSRQSSTSSENVIFSTKLGNANEIFTTKLPKQREIQKVLTESDVKELDIYSHKSITLPDIKPSENQTITKTKSAQIILETAELKTISEKQVVTFPKEKRVLELSQTSVSKSSTVSSNADEDHNSSESEFDSELDFPNKKSDLELKLDTDVNEPERKGLVLQQDSYDDELPYVPTTLPLERSAAIPIIPIKQRSTFEMKTYSIERPRSTTPINPSTLEEYCEEMMGSFDVENVTKTIEKLRISLPRNESYEKSIKLKSPRNTNWSDFAEKKVGCPKAEEKPPPLPPKGIQKEWINFEEIPERRKAPKRIQTIPSRGHIEVPEAVLQDNVVYNYVNPEDCRCECHEISAREREKRSQVEEPVPVLEDELPLLGDELHEAEKSTEERLKPDVADTRSVISDSSIDLSTSVEPPETINAETSLRTPFTSDLGMTSNRSSVISQDDPQSPESPNAFPKIF